MLIKSDDNKKETRSQAETTPMHRNKETQKIENRKKTKTKGERQKNKPRTTSL